MTHDLFSICLLGGKYLIIDLMEPMLLRTIKNIIWKHLDPKTTEAFIFGSRAVKTNSKFSDIDIGLKSSTKIPTKIKFMIEDDFENSDLPYIVETVDFSQVDEKFKQVSLKKIIPLN